MFEEQLSDDEFFTRWLTKLVFNTDTPLPQSTVSRFEPFKTPVVNGVKQAVDRFLSSGPEEENQPSLNLHQAGLEALSEEQQATFSARVNEQKALLKIA